MVWRWVMATALAGVMVMVVPALAQQTARQPHVTLGILVNPTPADANAQGVEVRSVSKSGPAGKAGIASNDVITKVGNQNVHNYNELEHVLAQHKPGDKVEVTIERSGETKTVMVTLGERGARSAELPQAGKAEEAGEAEASQQPSAYIGIEAAPLTPQMAEQMNIPAQHGAVIRDVMPNSPAANAGLQSDDVITAINGKDISDIDELRRAVEKAGPGKTITLSVLREGKKQSVKVKLQKAPSNFRNPPRGFGGFGNGFGQGGPGGFGNFGPGGFGNFGPGFGGLGGVNPQQQRIQQLERRVRELERRLNQLEKQQGQTPNK